MEIESFSQFINELDGSRLGIDLSEKVKEVVGAMEQHILNGSRKAKAQMSICLDFQMDDGLISVIPTIKTKVPEAVRQKSVFWPTSKGLSTANPNQPMLPFSTIEGQKNTVVTNF